MVKFYGDIGYAGETIETRPGVWEEQIVSRTYYGDVQRNPRRLQSGDQLNNDLSVNSSISIVADPYAFEHFFAMRYITWQGARWIVSDVSVEPPRLVLRLGGVYNGPIASPATPAP